MTSNQHRLFQAYQRAWDIGENHVYLYDKQYDAIRRKAIKSNFCEDNIYEIDKKNPTNEFEDIFASCESEMAPDIRTFIGTIKDRTEITDDEKVLVVRLFVNILSKSDEFRKIGLEDNSLTESCKKWILRNDSKAGILRLSDKVSQLKNMGKGHPINNLSNGKNGDEKIVRSLLQCALGNTTEPYLEKQEAMVATVLTNAKPIVSKLSAFYNVNIVVSASNDVLFSDTIVFDGTCAILPISPNIFATISLKIKAMGDKKVYRVHSSKFYTYYLYATDKRVKRICSNSEEALSCFQRVIHLNE